MDNEDNILCEDRVTGASDLQTSSPQYCEDQLLDGGAVAPDGVPYPLSYSRKHLTKLYCILDTSQGTGWPRMSGFLSSPQAAFPPTGPPACATATSATSATHWSGFCGSSTSWHATASWCRSAVSWNKTPACWKTGLTGQRSAHCQVPFAIIELH